MVYIFLLIHRTSDQLLALIFWHLIKDTSARHTRLSNELNPRTQSLVLCLFGSKSKVRTLRSAVAKRRQGFPFGYASELGRQLVTKTRLQASIGNLSLPGIR